MPILNKDMSVCISLSARPSNLGTRFHNYLYDKHGLNFIYKAFAPTDITAAIAGVRGLGIRGCSVSMPYKEAVIDLVDVMEPSASAISSVNTIVNDDGVLRASNTDYEAVAALLKSHKVDTSLSVLVRGSGGMAKAVVAAFRDAGFRDLTVWARNRETGAALATAYDFSYTDTAPLPGHAVVVNVTPLGMNGGQADELSFSEQHVAAASVVFDVVAFPSETPLIACARTHHRAVITGAEVIALQAARQFEQYTGVTLTAEDIAEASAFSRAEA